MEILDTNSVDYHRIVKLSPDLICVAGMDGYFIYATKYCQHHYVHPEKRKI